MGKEVSAKNNLAITPLKWGPNWRGKRKNVKMGKKQPFGGRKTKMACIVKN